MTRVTAVLAPLMGASVLACGLEGRLGTICTADYRYGLAVYVKDSATGAWAASGARLYTFMAGTPVDSATSFVNAPPAGRPDLDPYPLLGAGERKGVYHVVVRKAGYADWARSGVNVTADACHVRTVELTARLQARP